MRQERGAIPVVLARRLREQQPSPKPLLGDKAISADFDLRQIGHRADGGEDGDLEFEFRQFRGRQRRKPRVLGGRGDGALADDFVERPIGPGKPDASPQIACRPIHWAQEGVGEARRERVGRPGDVPHQRGSAQRSGEFAGTPREVLEDVRESNWVLRVPGGHDGQQDAGEGQNHLTQAGRPRASAHESHLRYESTSASVPIPRRQ